MKISVLQHDPSLHLPARAGDPAPVSRNLDPLQHPFARARERTRALNAAKLARIFAQPFVGAMGGHMDAVEALCCKRAGRVAASASWDGGIVLHNLTDRTSFLELQGAHKGKVSAIVFCRDPSSDETEGNKILSCGVDRTVKLWDVNEGGSKDAAGRLVTTYAGKSAFNSIDHHRHESQFATASNVVQLWDVNKSSPISTLTPPTQATSTLNTLRFSPSEPSLLISTGSERDLVIYDSRSGRAERRATLEHVPLCVSPHPLIAPTVLIASNDHNLYTFDLRSLSQPSHIFKAHVAAATSCAWSPDGTGFVSGGWDRTVRVWSYDMGREGAGGGGKKPEVYHTKRMQRVTSVLYDPSARFVLSGSDDGNVRVWKARASEKMGVITARERAAIEYREKLREKWRWDQDVNKIERTRHLPKPVYTAARLKRTMLEARRVKEERRRKHTRAGQTKPQAERKNVVLKEVS